MSASALGSARVTLLKRDGLGRVERLDTAERSWVRRVPEGGSVPGSRVLAKLLARRELRALAALSGLPGVPAGAHLDPSGNLLREHLVGLPLSQASALPADFFQLLLRLVSAVHSRGVCHNDLHKEQNVLVQADGRPALLDFQLASVHRRRGWVFASRVREDLRHVEKHRQRYLRAGRTREAAGLDALPRRGWIAGLWRRLGKPVYVFATRRILGTSDGEPRRPSSGPWPRWDPPLGDRTADPVGRDGSGDGSLGVPFALGRSDPAP